MRPVFARPGRGATGAWAFTNRPRVCERASDASHGRRSRPPRPCGSDAPAAALHGARCCRPAGSDRDGLARSRRRSRTRDQGPSRRGALPLSRPDALRPGGDRVRSLRGITLAVLASLAAALAVCAPAGAAAAPLVLGAPFGEHDGLTAGHTAGGTAVLAWRTTSGEGQALQVADIPPGGREAVRVETVTSSRLKRLSEPVLAVSPGGRVAIAWFEQRETLQVWGEYLLAVKVRERAANGGWGPIATVWRAPAKPRYSPRELELGVGDDGDSALLWTMQSVVPRVDGPGTLFASSRGNGGPFTAPVKLEDHPEETPAAVAVTPEGQVSALWARASQEGTDTLLARTWQAGASPTGAPATLDSGAGRKGSRDSLSGLTLGSAASGVQLAAWLRGVPGETARPNLVALRAAWKLPSAPFQTAQTVSPPGVEARRPALDLSASGRALLGWGEVPPSGGEPLLAYAIGEPGQ